MNFLKLSVPVKFTFHYQHVYSYATKIQSKPVFASSNIFITKELTQILKYSCVLYLYIHIHIYSHIYVHEIFVRNLSIWHLAYLFKQSLINSDKAVK